MYNLLPVFVVNLLYNKLNHPQGTLGDDYA